MTEDIALAIATTIQPLIVDCYKGDGVTPDKIATLISAGYPWSGLSMQCSNGVSAAGRWFTESWYASGRTGSAGSRYGVDWFRMAYHYYVVGQSSRQQSEVAIAAIESAGGWDDGDLWLGVDVERGQQPAGATKLQVETEVASFADGILRLTGKRPVLYAGSYTRDLGITSRMGCCLLWYPQWNSSLNWSTVQRMGWDMNSTLLWQVAGTSAPATVPGYPTTTPIGMQDFSVMVRANLPPADGLAWTATHTGSRPVLP